MSEALFPSGWFPNSCAERPNSWHHVANGHGRHRVIPRTQTRRERGITSQDCVYINCLATLLVFVCVRFRDFLLPWFKHTHTHTHTQMSAVWNQYQYTSSGLTQLAVVFKAVAQSGRDARLGTSPKTRQKPCSGALMCASWEKECLCLKQKHLQWINIFEST